MGASSARDEPQASAGAASGVGGAAGSAGSAGMGGVIIPTPISTALRGVSLAGAEFGRKIPGTYDSDYTYPTRGEINYFAGKGMNTFRLPFLWERLQPTLSGELDADEAGRVDAFVSAATAQGACVILDPHNYARYQSDPSKGPLLLGFPGGPKSADLADLWRRLATLYAANDHVIFALMNEPHDIALSSWLTAANASIDAIRAAGAANLILVPGVAWTGAWSWLDNNTAMTGTVDPLDHFVFEVHQYNDQDSSGTHDTCVSSTIGSERLTAFNQWLTDNGKQAMLGEFAGPNNDTCLAALDDMLNFLDAHGDQWVGWTYWAAGPWWGPQPESGGSIIEPTSAGDAPQMPILLEHL